MTASAVVKELENCVGKSYKWDAGGIPGSLHRWLTTDTESSPPDMVTGGMQCFGLPIRVAYNLGALDFAAASNMYSNFLIECGTGKEPKSICSKGVTQAYWTKTSCLPCFSTAGTDSIPRGSAVFFSAKNINYNAHFAVATGKGTEMISFGHGASGPAASLKVAALDMDDLQDLYQGKFTACHYGAPSW